MAMILMKTPMAMGMVPFLNWLQLNMRRLPVTTSKKASGSRML